MRCAVNHQLLTMNIGKATNKCWNQLLVLLEELAINKDLKIPLYTDRW